jgi:CheY-like chemotaxis protein
MTSEMHKILIADPDQRSVVILTDALKEKGYSVLLHWMGPRHLILQSQKYPI